MSGGDQTSGVGVGAPSVTTGEGLGFLVGKGVGVGVGVAIGVGSIVGPEGVTSICSAKTTAFGVTNTLEAIINPTKVGVKPIKKALIILTISKLYQN